MHMHIFQCSFPYAFFSSKPTKAQQFRIKTMILKTNEQSTHPKLRMPRNFLLTEKKNNVLTNLQKTKKKKRTTNVP